MFCLFFLSSFINSKVNLGVKASTEENGQILATCLEDEILDFRLRIDN